MAGYPGIWPGGNRGIISSSGFSFGTIQKLKSCFLFPTPTEHDDCDSTRLWATRGKVKLSTTPGCGETSMYSTRFLGSMALD